jgi:hypothetical protein
MRIVTAKSPKPVKLRRQGVMVEVPAIVRPVCQRGHVDHRAARHGEAEAVERHAGAYGPGAVTRPQ